MEAPNSSIADKLRKFDHLMESGTVHALQEWLDWAHIPYQLGHLEVHERRLYEACKRLCQESHTNYVEALAWAHSVDR